MATSLNASLNVSLNPQSLNASTKQIQQALGRITGQASEFQKSLDASTARVFAFGATTAVLNSVNQSFKKLVSTTIEVEKRLIEVNAIFQASETTFNRFRTAIFQVAKETGQSFATVADGAAELARQGLSAEETASRLKSALVLTRISGLDAEKSVKALTAAINGFASAGLSHVEIVNKIVAVDTAFAVSAQDLAEAFSRAGSTAEDAGVSFNELLGLVTAVEQRTARGGAVIGNAFKSIFTRLQRGTTIDSLKELGVQIDANMTGVEKLSALSNALERISDPTVSAKIKELAGGVFQINVVSAALKDIGDDASIFASATSTAIGATNEAFEKNAALSESVASNINALVQTLTSLGSKIGTITFAPLLENLLGIATKLSDFLDKALDPEKGNVFIKGLFKAIGSFLSGPAVIIFTTAFIKIFKLVAKFAGDGLKALFTIGTQTEKIKNIEGGIVGLLARDENLRNLINSSTATQVQKEQAVIQAIKTQNSLLQQQAGIVRALATASAARGVGGFNEGTGVFTRGRRGRAFAVGGKVSGGSGTKDDVPAMLTAGEFVMRKSAVDKFGEPFMSNLNQGRLGFNKGGVVPNFVRINAATLRGRSPSRLFDKKGRPTGDTQSFYDADGNILPDVDDEIRSILIAKRSKHKSGKGGSEPRLSVPAKSKFGMFIPKLNRTGKPVLRTISKAKEPKLAQSSFIIGKTSVPYSLEGAFNIFGPMIPEGVDEAQDPQAEQLEKNVKDSIINASRKFADTLIPATKRGKASKGEISRKLGLGSSQEGAAGGAKGAVNAAVGAAFEAAVLTGLNLNPPKKADNQGRGDFDIRPVGEKIARLFLDNKFSSIAVADLKNSDSKGNIKSFIKKLANEKYGSLAAMQAAMDPNKGASKKTVKRNKGGIIPNFSLGRKIADSKIRIHKDMMTGQPLAVTNIEDEPRGLRDAIDRERNGIPLGAMGGGLVPNYAPTQQQILAQAMKRAESRGKTTQQLRKSTGGGVDLSGGMEKFGKGLEKATMGLFAVQMGLGTMAAKSEEGNNAKAAEIEAEIEAMKASGADTAITFELIKAKKEELKSVQESKTAMTGLAEGANFAITALMSAQALNAVTAGKAGQFGMGALGMGKRGLARIGPRALGAAGGIAAAGIGGFQLLSAANKDDLKAGERRDKAFKGASALGGAAIGAGIGSLVPVIGTAIGAAIGGGIGLAGGTLFKKGARSDAASAARQARGEQTLRIAQGASSVRDQLGFDGNQKQFESVIDDNLAAIEKEEGGIAKALQIRQRLDVAREKQAQVIADETSTELQKAAANQELLAANKAAVGLKHATFAAEAEALAQFNTLRKQQFNSERKLIEAQRKLASAQIDRMKILNDAKRGAEMNVGLSSAIRGPFADNVRLASEQNLTQRNLAIGKEEIRAAQDKLDAADPSDENFSKLKNDVETASEKFKDAVAKAGVGLVQKMRQVADALKDAREKGKELESQRVEILESFIDKVVSGQTTGDLSEAAEAGKRLQGLIGILKKEEEKQIKAARAKAARQGEEFDEKKFREEGGLKISSSLTEAISQERMEVQRLADEAAGAGSEIAKKFIENFLTQTESGVLGRTAIARRASVTDTTGLTSAQAGRILGAATEGVDEQINENTQALISLKGQLDSTKGAFEELQRQVSGTEAEEIPKKIKQTVGAMNLAATSSADVARFTSKLSTELEKTTTFLENNADFVKTQEGIVTSLTRRLEELQTKVDELTN